MKMMFDLRSIIIMFLISGLSLLIHQFLIKNYVSTKGNRLFFYFVFALHLLTLQKLTFLKGLQFSGGYTTLNLGKFGDVISTSENIESYYGKILVLVYLVGVCFGVAKMTIGIVKIIGLIRNSSVGQHRFVRKVNGTNFQPFTFFNYILIPAQLPKAMYTSVYGHERYHVSKMHSVDMFMWGVLSILFWFNPFVHLLKARQALNLEFDTDEHMIKSISRNRYCEHLLSSTFTSDLSKIGFYPMFNTSNIYLRIKRLRNVPTTNRTGSNLLLLVLCSVLLMGTFLVKASFLVRTGNKSLDQFSKPEFSPYGLGHYVDSVFQRSVGNRFDHIDKDFYLRLFLDIVIDESGNVIHVEEDIHMSKRSNDPRIDEFTSNLLIEIIQNMPNWTPAKTDGIGVRSEIKEEFLFVGEGEY